MVKCSNEIWQFYEVRISIRGLYLTKMFILHVYGWEKKYTYTYKYDKYMININTCIELPRYSYMKKASLMEIAYKF